MVPPFTPSTTFGRHELSPGLVPHVLQCASGLLDLSLWALMEAPPLPGPFPPPSSPTAHNGDRRKPRH